MSVNAADIVEQQLTLLSDRSAKGLLTFDETKALESLIKLQIILRMKGAKPPEGSDLTDMSTDELRKTLQFLEATK